MKTKHDNKGFTLVELLVAVAVLMIVMAELYSVINNTSKVYQMGSYEVSLQMEAQQTFQLLEELMIDANSEIQYSPSSKTLTISGNALKADGTRGDEYKYEVKYYAAGEEDPETHETLVYGRVKLKVVAGVVQHWEPIADYVDSFDVDMSQYDKSDTVTLNMTLHNERYSYQASKDVYLRNGIGVSDNHSLADSTDAEYFVDCKRFGTYDLKAVTKEIDNGKTTTYSEFYFQEKAGATGEARRTTTDYKIDTNGKIRCTSTLNNNFSANRGPVIVIATGGKTVTAGVAGEEEAPDAKISITTDPVGIGANNYGVILLRCSTTSEKGTSLSQVRGISLEDAKKVEYSISCNWSSSITGTSSFGGYSSGAKTKTNKVTAQGSDGNSTQPYGWETTDSWDSDLKKGSHSYMTYGGSIGCFDKKMNFFFDCPSNSIGVTSTGWQEAAAYNNFLQFTDEKNRLVVNAKVTWDDGSEKSETFQMVFFPDKQDGKPSGYRYLTATERAFLLPDSL